MIHTITEATATSITYVVNVLERPGDPIGPSNKAIPTGHVIELDNADGGLKVGDRFRLAVTKVAG